MLLLPPSDPAGSAAFADAAPAPPEGEPRARLQFFEVKGDRCVDLLSAERGKELMLANDAAGTTQESASPYEDSASPARTAPPRSPTHTPTR